MHWFKFLRTGRSRNGIKNLKDVFEKYPQLKKVYWHAYTPYFNDGEECTFSSGHDDPEFEAEGVQYDDPTYKNIRADLKSFLVQFDDDLMKNLFGDHVEIVVTKEGIEISEYEHE